MNVEKEFSKIMASQTKMALATCEDSIPNVRVVNFIYNEQEKLLYFATFSDNDKVKEIEVNHQTAFTTIPHKGNKHVRAKGQVQRSHKTIFDLAGDFSKKIPGYGETIEQVGAYLLVYEMSFARANVILTLESAEILELS